MLHLVWRQFVTTPLHSAFVTLAVAAAIAVILVLRSFETGLYMQSRAMVLDRGADLFVQQAGVANFVAARSSLPQLMRERVELIDGVAAAHPMTTLFVIYDHGSHKTPLGLLVYDDRGGPPLITEGNAPQSERDVVIDIGLAKKFAIRPGDPLVISDFEFHVAGITEGSSAFFSPFAYISYDGMIDLFLESEIAPDISAFPLLSYLLVELAPGAHAETVAAAIENTLPDVDVLSPGQLAENDVQMGRDMFGPVMGVLVLIAYIISLLVIGLIVYADVSNRLRSFAVLKALGFRLSHFSSGVFARNILLLLGAFPLAVILALIIAAALEANAPVYLVPVLHPEGLLRTFAGVVMVSLLAGLLPLRLIARTDPVAVFQGR